LVSCQGWAAGPSQTFQLDYTDIILPTRDIDIHGGAKEPASGESKLEERTSRVSANSEGPFVVSSPRSEKAGFSGDRGKKMIPLAMRAREQGRPK